MLTKLANEPVVFLLRKAWQFAEGRRWLFVTYVTFFVLSNVVAFLQPLLIGFILNELQANGISPENFRYVSFLIFGFFGIYVVYWFFHGFGRIWENKLAFEISRTYKEHLFRGVVDLPLAWHSDRDSGDTIDKVNKASHALYTYLNGSFMVIQSIVSALGTVVVLWFFDLWISLGVFLFVAMALFVMYRFDKVLVPQYMRLNVFDNRIGAKVFDALSNITSVIILRIQSVIASSVTHSFWKPHGLYMQNNRLGELKWFAVSFFFTAIIVVFLIVYLYQQMTLGAALQIGTVSALYLYLNSASTVFQNFGWLYSEIIQHKASVENAEPLEGAVSNNHPLEQEAFQIEYLSMQNLHFSYDSVENAAKTLDVDSFSVARGERIALIGESGSGKTTFLKVLHGLYPFVSSELHINGSYVPKSFAELDLGTMLVPQEPELFSVSIRENITFGMEYAEDRIGEVLRLACFADVVKELPKGLESVVNEKGVNLSGGQKQRLALARALLFARGKQIILLDESTSSVDSRNEGLIYEQIFETFHDKTFIASIHKMNLLRYFDRIVIFDKGQVRAEGTFQELLGRDLQFRDQWEIFQRSGV